MAGTEKRNALIYINGVEVNNTLSSIESHARKLRAEMQHLDRSTDEFQKTLNSLQATNKILAGHRQQVAGVNKAWQDVKMQLKGFGATMLAYLGGNAILSGFRNLIQKNVELSKAQTAVERTTQLTSDQMAQLNKNLDGLNTKTARMELLKLAEEAGRQGKNTVESVTEFVSDMDKAIVALGGDLGPAVIEQLGKLSTIFDTSTLKIGNAIKAISDASIASAPYQVDFMMRTAGVAETVGVLSDELLGMGATLENLGQSQEVSGTAINQFLLKLTQNTNEFGRIAGFSDGELQKLIGEKGTNAGFVAFLEKLKESSTGTTDLVTRLNELGLDGTRNAAVLLTLANNTELLAKQQAVAKDAIGETDLVMDSFNKSNSDFAANWAKFQKNINSFFMNNALSQGFMKLIGNLVDTRTEAQKAADAFNEQKSSVEALEKKVIPLRDRYTELASKANLNSEEQVELKKIIAQISTILPSAVTEWDKYGNAIGISTQKINEHLAAERELVRLKNADAIKAAYTEINKLMGEIDAKAAEISRGGYMAAGTGLKSSAAQFVPISADDIKKLQQEIDQAKGKLVESYLTIENTLGQTLSASDQLKMQLYGVTSTGMNLTAAYYNQVSDTANKTGQVVADANAAIEENINALNGSTGLEQAKKKMEDLSGAAEEIRQELFLLTADDKTKALAELDAFFEELYIKAVTAGLSESEISILFDVWKQRSLELEQQFNAAADAVNRMFGGDSGGGDNADTKAAEAADKRRQQIEEELNTTIQLREERERYLESIYMAGAAAIENAENEQEAIRGVINAIRNAIKQRIMDAVAAAISQVLASVPFPLSLILGAVAGAGAQKLFDKLVPQAADGGYRMDVIGAQTGRGYRASVNQKFMGGYATQPMLVGEHGAEYTVPNYLMQNPYALRLVDELEGLRKGGSGPNNEAQPMDMRAIYELIEVLKSNNNKPTYAILPDQTVIRFNERSVELEPISKKANR